MLSFSIALLLVWSGQPEVLDPVVTPVSVDVIDRHTIRDLSIMEFPDYTVTQALLRSYAHGVVPIGFEGPRNSSWGPLPMF